MTDRPPRLVVSVHDVAPATAAAGRRWVRLLDALAIPLTLLVVPGPWQGRSFGDPADDGQDLPEWLRARVAGGDEVQLHGWCHRADVPGTGLRRLAGSVAARGAAELWALDEEETLRRAQEGLAVLAAHGLHPTGTTPPGWLAGPDALRGLRRAGLDYTTDHRGLVDLRDGTRWNAPALCHRPAGTGPQLTAGERLGAGLVRAARRLTARGRDVRLAVHPADLTRPGMADAVVDTVAGCLRAGAVARTYAQVLAQRRAGTT